MGSRRLSDHLKNALVLAWENGQSFGSLATTFQIHKSTAHKIVTKYKKTGSTANIKNKGKPRGTTG